MQKALSSAPATPAIAGGVQPTQFDLRQNLREDLLNALLLGLPITAVIVVVGLATAADELSPMRLLPAFVLGVTWSISKAVRSKWGYTPAASMLIFGLIAAVGSAALVFGLANNPIIYGIPVVVMVAGLLLRPAATYGTAASSTLLLVLIALLLGDFSRPNLTAIGVSAGFSFISASVAWLASHTMIMTTDWAVQAYGRVQYREEMLYQSQQELARTVNEKEGLNFELRKMNTQLDAARTQAEEVSRLKTQFMATISHELRTPLNAVISFSYIMQQGLKGPVTEEQYDYLGRIHDSGEHLLQLINDILDLSKIEAGRFEIHPGVIPLPRLVDQALSTSQGLIKGKPIVLESRLPADLPEVYADGHRTMQVLLNLLSNAIKFTDEGSVRVEAEVQPTHIVMSVRDSGIGIPKESFKIIFEEFRQVDGSTTRAHGGTGLGLAITRRLVELQHGRIWFESEENQGTTFFWTLPRADVRELNQAETEPAPTVATA